MLAGSKKQWSNNFISVKCYFSNGLGDSLAKGFSSFPDSSFDAFVATLESMLDRLPKQEAKVAQYMLLNLNTLSLETGKSLAIKVGVPEVTVGRMLKRLGYNGIKELKVLLRRKMSLGVEFQDGPSNIDISYQHVADAELAGLHAVFAQVDTRPWTQAVQRLTDAPTVYVTGFQTVRGVAEDYSKRLALARSSVRYVSPHDGMLAEWISHPSKMAKGTCLLMVEVVPYARESLRMAQVAQKLGIQTIIVTDEFNHWAKSVSDTIIFVPTRTGLFLESTTGITLALSLLVNAVAQSNELLAQERLEQWKRFSSQIGLF